MFYPVIAFCALAFFSGEVEVFRTDIRVPAHEVWHTQHAVFGIDTVLVRFPEDTYAHHRPGTLLGYEILQSWRKPGYLPYATHRYSPPFTYERVPPWRKRPQQMQR